MIELDELYDQFSYWLDDPDGSAKNERNVAVFRFAHSLLKRALSDSFANAVPPPPTSGSPVTSALPTSDRKSRQQRSWSLVDHLGDERLALQVAKEVVGRPEVTPEVAPPETGSKRKMAAQLVSIILQQTLADVELELQVKASASASSIQPEVAPLPVEANNNIRLLSNVNRHLDFGTSAFHFFSALLIQFRLIQLNLN